MELLEFVAAVPNFSGLSHPDRILHFGWYLHSHKNKERFTQADIRHCCDALPMEEPNLSDGRAIRYSPFSALIGSDGGIRLQQRLDNSQNPVLVMGDSKTETRLLLGHRLSQDVAGDLKDPWDRWGLSLSSVRGIWCSETVRARNFQHL
jgi:hypothetical protein